MLSVQYNRLLLSMSDIDILSFPLINALFLFRLQIPASVISSVGAVNYPQTTALIVVTAASPSKPSNNVNTTLSSDNKSGNMQTIPIVVTQSQAQIQDPEGRMAAQPRMHPKKRKYDYIEEVEPPPAPPTSTVTSDPQNVESQVHQQQQHIVTTNSPQKVASESYTLTLPTTAVQHQIRVQKMPENYVINKNMFSSNSTVLQTTTYKILQTAQAPPPPLQPSTAPSNAELIDLREWVNHRVLARRKDVFVPGIISYCDPPNSVHVMFDYPEGAKYLFTDIFSAGRYDIISDASPSISDVSGLQFCYIFIFPIYIQ
jgi:hypothetical protein